MAVAYSVNVEAQVSGITKTVTKAGSVEQTVHARIQVPGNVTDYTTVTHNLGLMTAPKIIVIKGGPGVTAKVGADATAIAGITEPLSCDPFCIIGEDVPLPTNDYAFIAIANAHGQSQVVTVMAVE